jgi:hypothetical protein
LKRRDVGQAREQKRVEVSGWFWAGDNASRKNVAYLVTLVGPKIHEYPHVNPAVGLFAFVELRAVHRQHKYRVVFADSLVINKIQISSTAEDVVVKPRGVARCCTFAQKFQGLLPTVVHVLGCLEVFATSLDLGADWKGRENLPRNLPFPTRFIKLLLIVASFPTTRAAF